MFEIENLCLKVAKRQVVCISFPSTRTIGCDEMAFRGPDVISDNHFDPLLLCPTESNLICNPNFAAASILVVDRYMFALVKKILPFFRSLTRWTKNGFIGWRRGLSRSSSPTGIGLIKPRWKARSRCAPSTMPSLSTTATVVYARRSFQSMPFVVWGWTKLKFKNWTNCSELIPFRPDWQRQCLCANFAKRFAASSKRRQLSQTISKPTKITSSSWKSTNEGNLWPKNGHLAILSTT